MASQSVLRKGTTESARDADAFRAAQRLSYETAVTIGKELRPGWTESRAAALMGTYLKDRGVKAFFHEPYAWFGDRTRFSGIDRLKYSQFNPTHRQLEENDVVILDVAPIVDGCVGDIGYALKCGDNPEWDRGMAFLRKLREDIPKLFSKPDRDGATIWNDVDKKIRDAGFDNVHQIYPFNVLGHRVRRVPLSGWALKTPLRFSMHSLWQILSDGFTSELLNSKHHGDLTGLWAIEPHIGWQGGGAKFEEILIVTKEGAHWLDDDVPHARIL